MPNKLFLFYAIVFSNSACVIGFRNAEQSIESSFRRVYMPPAIDNSSLGGASARISYAVRRTLSLDTNIQLVSVEEARMAVDIRIREQTRAPSGTVVDCKTEEAKIGSKAYNCKELGISQATLAAENEILQLYAVADFIDLETGRNIASLVYRLSADYPTVSSDETERNDFARRPDLHALRYFERHDAALASLGNTIASDIVTKLRTINLSAAPSIPIKKDQE